MNATSVAIRRTDGKRHAGVGQLDSQMTDGLQSLDGFDQGWSADSDGSCSQLVEHRSPAIRRDLQQVLQTQALIALNSLDQQFPEALFDAATELGDESFQNGAAR